MFLNENLITTNSIINKVREKHNIPISVHKYYSLTTHNFESIKDKYLYFPKPSDFNFIYFLLNQMIGNMKKN